DFSEDDALTAHCQNIWVNPDRQRQGIANAVYVFAELVLGRVLRDYWRDDSHQSEAAQALWAQSNRPFGHLPARGSSGQVPGGKRVPHRPRGLRALTQSAPPPPHTRSAVDGRGTGAGVVRQAGEGADEGRRWGQEKHQGEIGGGKRATPDP